MGKIPELRRNSSKVLPILTYHDDIFGEARPGLFNRRGPPIDTTTTLVVYYKTMALCLICRGLLGYRFSQEQMFRDDIYTEDKKWVKFKRKRRVIFMEARELEAKDFKNKNIDHWVSLYRLMWYDPAEEKLVISGIGHYDSRAKSNAAAKNYSKAVIGSAKRATKAEREHFTIAYDTNAFLQSSNNWSARDLDWRQLPFPIHMGCWKLALWELGPSIENNNLELFAAIVLRNFAFTHYCREHHDDAERKFDPYRITRVQEVIARSCDSGHKKRREAADRKRQPFTPSYSKAILNLPVELLHLILDLLEYREIKKLEFALGTFSVADSRYWRQRASRNLLEMDEVALLPDVDWRYLCMALERIRGGDDFEARHRVLGILRGEIKPIVLQNLKEREVPSLEEIVDQVREMGVQMWEDEF